MNLLLPWCQSVNTRHLDFSIQRGAPKPTSSPFVIDASQDKDKDQKQIYVGGLGSNCFVK
jgi:hypothetical protein